MSFYEHGGDLMGAQKLFNIKSKEFLDFSSNINSIGYPQELEDIIITAIKNLSIYPDNKYSALRNSISQYLDVEKSDVIPGNGAMELIDIAIRIPTIKKILIIAPTFVEYENLSFINNKNVEYYCLKEEDDFLFLPDDVLSQINFDIDAVIICNPNNPTSKLYDKDKMLYFVDQCSKRNIVVILDETFIELTLNGNNDSLCKKTEEYPNLIVIRAVTKYFAVPGIRLGYAITSKLFRDFFWKNKLSWSVNTFAASLGEVFANEKFFRLKTLDWMGSEVNFLYNKLKEIKKFKVYKPDTIFILLKIISEEFSSKDLYQQLGKRGILIREAKNFKFLDERFVRVAVKDRDSNIKLLEAINNICGR